MLTFNSLIILSFVFTIFLYSNYLRGKRKYKFQIHPNCLLTKHTIVFLSGKTSLFYFGRYWNYIPSWLEAHGYDILEFTFAKNNSNHRKDELLAFLELSEGEAYHFIGDASAHEEMHWLALQNHPSVKSLSIATTKNHTPHCKEIHYLPLTLIEKTSGNRNYWQFATFFHSLWQAPLEFNVVGLGCSKEWGSIARQYLNWAISLAENDLSC